MLSAVGTNEGIELLLNRLAKTDSNAQFLATLTKSLEQPPRPARASAGPARLPASPVRATGGVRVA